MTDLLGRGIGQKRLWMALALALALTAGLAAWATAAWSPGVELGQAATVSANSVHRNPLAAALVVSKTLTLPADRAVLFEGELVNFVVEIANRGDTAIDVLPLTDAFDDACLSYDPAETAPPGSLHDATVSWGDLTVPFDGNLGPNEAWVVIIGFKVTGSSGAGRNSASVAEARDVNGQVVQVDATAAEVQFSCVKPPAISLTSTPDRETIRSGETVTYTYGVSNPGGTPLAEVAVHDDTCTPVVGPAGDDGDGLLDTDESWTYTCSVSLTSDTTNIAVVSGQPTDHAGNLLADVEAVQAQATSAVRVSNSAVALELTADSAYVLPGQIVTYTYRVASLGNAALRKVTVIDDVCLQTPQAPASGDHDRDGVLDPGETWLYTCTTAIWEDVVANAVVQAEDSNGSPVQAEAAAAVDVVQPLIDLTATAQPTITLPGAVVTYTYLIANSGDVQMFDVQVVDDHCEALTGPVGDDGDDRLAVAESWQYQCASAVTADVINTVVVSAQPGDDAGSALSGIDRVTERAELFVDIVRPAIGVMKTAQPSVVYRGGTVTYTYRVSNPGDTPLASIAVSDAGCAPVTGPVQDANGNALLDPGETWIYTCSLALTQDAATVGSVTGWPSRVDGSPLPGIPGVLGSAAAAVDVINPGLVVLTVASAAEVWPGDTIRYVYQVTNSGDDPLRALNVSDDRCSPVTRETIDGDGVLDPRQMWVFSCAYTVSSRDRSALVTTATALGRDSADHTVTAADRASVTIRPGAVIGGLVWNDNNGDGMPQTGESGMAGAGVNLIAADGTVFAAVTAATGRYVFDNLPAGSYSVVTDLATVPANLTLSTIESPLKVTVTNGQVVDECHFGYVLAGKVGGMAYIDSVAANGVRDPGEYTPVGDLSVALIDMQRGRAYSVQTDSFGEYTIAGLPPGRYLLSAEAPAALAPTTMLPKQVSLAVGQSALMHDIGWLARPLVSVVLFDSQARAQQLVLRWEVLLNGEDDPGFCVWRSARGADWQRLTPAPVYLSGTNQEVSLYEYSDSTARSGQVYLYRLQVMGGGSFGPWQARLAGGRVYLPAVQMSH